MYFASFKLVLITFCVVSYYTNYEKLLMHTTLKCEACLYNRMAISILIVININYNLLIIINIYTNDCKCIN